MAGIRRVSDLGTKGWSNILDGSIVTADLANNSVTQAKLDTSVPLSGNRNVLINGSFELWQRTNSSEYTAQASAEWKAPDRWWTAQLSTVSTLIVSRQTADTSFLQYGCRVQRKAGQTGTGTIYLGQVLESSMSKRFSGQQATLSFYVKKGANAPSTFNVVVYSGNGTDQSSGSLFSAGWTSGAAIIDQSVTPTTTMTRYSYTFSVGSINQLGVWFKWTPSGTAGADEWFQFEGVQLEIGSQVTPFEQRLHPIELMLCQRYYQVVASGANAGIGNVTYTNTNTLEGYIHLPVQMRTTPTLASQTTSGTNYYTVLSYSGGYDYLNYVYLDSISNNRNIALYNNSEASGTGGQAGIWWCYAGAGSPQFVALQSEL